MQRGAKVLSIGRKVSQSIPRLLEEPNDSPQFLLLNCENKQW